MTANADQVKYWNEVSGAAWIEHEEALDTLVHPFGLRAMDVLAVEPGMRIIDIGCGCGGTTIELARRTGPAGQAVGVDLSRPMVERARRRAAEAGVENAAFVLGDAQTAELPAESDGAFSRFGIMFFDDPRAAFANIRGALRGGGRLVFACWQGLDANPWLWLPARAADPHIGVTDPAPPDVPGPFGLADPKRTEGLLEDAGFGAVSIEACALEVQAPGGSDTEDVAGVLLEILPTRHRMREAPEDARAQARRAVAAALRPHAAADGVRLRGAAWVVSATA